MQEPKEEVTGSSTVQAVGRKWKEVGELKVCFESGIDNTWKDSDCSDVEAYERQNVENISRAADTSPF